MDIKHTIKVFNGNCIECEWEGYCIPDECPSYTKDEEIMMSINKNKKYICIQNCPELDEENIKHCTSFDCITYDCTRDCPCGNIPIWKECEEQ